jgi:hypothetical protein
MLERGETSFSPARNRKTTPLLPAKIKTLCKRNEVRGDSNDSTLQIWLLEDAVSAARKDKTEKFPNISLHPGICLQ